MATKKDYLLVSIIGLAVGLLAQPILANNMDTLRGVFPYSDLAIRLLVWAFFVVLAPIALFVASWIGLRARVVFQFAKFAAVGSLNSFMDLGIFNLLSYIFVDEVRNISRVLFITFKSISFFVATLNSYLWNKNWTFGDREKTHTEVLVKFYLITAINYFLNIGVAFVVKEAGPFFGVPGNLWVSFVAPVCGILAAMFSNFLSYKFIVFKKPVNLTSGETPATI